MRATKKIELLLVYRVFVIDFDSEHELVSVEARDVHDRGWEHAVVFEVVERRNCRQDAVGDLVPARSLQSDNSRAVCYCQRMLGWDDDDRVFVEGDNFTTPTDREQFGGKPVHDDDLRSLVGVTFDAIGQAL